MQAEYRAKDGNGHPNHRADTDGEPEAERLNGGFQSLLYGRQVVLGRQVGHQHVAVGVGQRLGLGFGETGGFQASGEGEAVEGHWDPLDSVPRPIIPLRRRREPRRGDNMTRFPYVVALVGLMGIHEARAQQQVFEVGFDMTDPATTEGGTCTKQVYGYQCYTAARIVIEADGTVKATYRLGEGAVASANKGENVEITTPAVENPRLNPTGQTSIALDKWLPKPMRTLVLIPDGSGGFSARLEVWSPTEHRLKVGSARVVKVSNGK